MNKLKILIVLKRMGLWLIVVILTLVVAGVIGTSLNSLAAFNANQLTMIILSGLIGYVLDLKKSQQYSLLIFSFILSFMLPASQTATVIIFLPLILKKVKLI